MCFSPFAVPVDLLQQQLPFRQLSFRFGVHSLWGGHTSVLAPSKLRVQEKG